MNTHISQQVVRALVVLAAGAMVFQALPAQALSLYWEGRDSNDWHNTNNWDSYSVPTSADAALLNKGSTLVSSPAQASTVEVAYFGPNTLTLNSSLTTGFISVGRISGAGIVNINTGGGLTVGSTGFHIGDVSGGIGTVNMTGGSATVDGNILIGVSTGSTGTLNLSGGIVEASGLYLGEYGGSASLVQSSGTLSLTNAGIYVRNSSSSVTFTGGTVSASEISLAAGSVMTDSGGTLNVPSIANNGSLVYSNSAGVLSRTNVISGSGSITKAGIGRLELGANNSYTGSTTVSGGVLALNGNNSLATGAVTVSSGATLAGSGTVGGATAIQSGAIHAPGNSPGIQTFNDGLTYVTGATFVWELSANVDTGRGIAFDGVGVAGGILTINAGVTSSLVFNDAASSVNWSDVFWSSNHQWLVFDNTATPSVTSGVFDTINVGVDSLAQSLGSSRAGSSFTWEAIGSDVYLNYTVPEPSTYILLALGLVGVLANSRLKRLFGRLRR